MVEEVGGYAITKKTGVLDARAGVVATRVEGAGGEVSRKMGPGLSKRTRGDWTAPTVEGGDRGAGGEASRKKLQ